MIFNKTKMKEQPISRKVNNTNLEEIEKFSNIILDRVIAGNIEYVDAIVTYCEEIDQEVESIIGLLSPFIMAKLEEEAINNKVLKYLQYFIMYI